MCATSAVCQSKTPKLLRYLHSHRRATRFSYIVQDALKREQQYDNALVQAAQQNIAVLQGISKKITESKKQDARRTGAYYHDARVSLLTLILGSHFQLDDGLDKRRGTRGPGAAHGRVCIPASHIARRHTVEPVTKPSSTDDSLVSVQKQQPRVRRGSPGTGRRGIHA